ncbi:MAG: hypothetical protein QM668_18955 [Agriterribacter sp.]
MATYELNKEKKSYIATHKKYAKHNKRLLHETNSRNVILDCINNFLVIAEDDDFEDFFSEMDDPW